jgi:hypothetical protein
MDSTTNGGVLVECVAPLNEEGRRAVRRYWEQVIREEWAEPVRRMPRAVPSDADIRRERREARRAIARIAAASRVAQVVALRSTLASPAAGSTGEAA